MGILNLISLYRREDRLIQLAYQLKQTGAPVRLWEGVESELNPAANINLAHRTIIQWAKDNNEPFCIIGEDDIIFSHPNSWKYFLSQMPKPEDFDLFFGMIYSAEVKENRIVNGFSGLTLYVVSAKFYDFFLSMPPHVHVDRWLGMTAHEHDYFIIDKYVAKQSGGYSDNLRMNMSYQPFEEKMTFYNGE
jgi:hypothetical protein